MNHQAALDDDFLSRLTPDQRRRYERCRVRQQAFAAELFHADEPLRHKRYVAKESLEARLSLHAANLGDMLAAIAGRCPPDLAAELHDLRDWTAADSRRIVDDLFGRRRRDLAATTETPSPAEPSAPPLTPTEARTADENASSAVCPPPD